MQFNDFLKIEVNKSGNDVIWLLKSEAFANTINVFTNGSDMAARVSGVPITIAASA